MLLRSIERRLLEEEGDSVGEADFKVGVAVKEGEAAGGAFEGAKVRSFEAESLAEKWSNRFN